MISKGDQYKASVENATEAAHADCDNWNKVFVDTLDSLGLDIVTTRPTDLENYPKDGPICPPYPVPGSQPQWSRNSWIAWKTPA